TCSSSNSKKGKSLSKNDPLCKMKHMQKKEMYTLNFSNILNRLYERMIGALTVKIATEKVIKMLNQWYGMIRQQKIEQAIAIKDEIENMLPIMEEDQDVLLYFNVLDFRHKIMLENLNESKLLLKKLELEKEGIEKTDALLQYYFYFFSGQYEFHNKNYIKAINLYQIAEDKLKQIPDEIENAEFHYRVAIAYYRIKQHFFSLSHAQKALESFNADGNYSEKSINSEMILGANKMDLFRYEEAEKHYKHALVKAREEKFPYAESLALYNLGLNYGRRNMLLESADCFRSSLDIEECKKRRLAIKAKFELALVLYKLDSKNEAHSLCEQGLSEAQTVEEREYIAKFNFIRALYDQEDSGKIEESLKYLEGKKLWFHVAELMLEAAFHYKKTRNIIKAAHFFEKAHCARNQIFKVTEGLK
ncbi:Rap family tetratricopeptide repeat protein, partial [Bacillus haynesii]|uniref:Rap family tetratricopeptide repeat protein n=1 Tax=Bacillus haynesii TaxID=1925021 RepID=UPI002281A592